MSENRNKNNTKTRNYGKNHILSLVRLLLAAVLMISLVPSAVYAYEAAGNSYADPDVFDVFEEYSTYSADKKTKLTDSFYYSDEWFQEDPEMRNDSLALLSMQLTAAATEADEAGCGASLLKKLGFDEVGFTNFNTEDPDDCAYTWARKTVGDSTLVAVVLQSHATSGETTEQGWMQNFHVNGETAEGEHYAFAKAAGSVLDSVAELGGTGSVKYWITGQSRGGALADLVAAKLPGKLAENGASNKGIYAYTFESPAVVDKDYAPDYETAYGYIHNYLCSDDIVTRIPMWDMVRYGTVVDLKTEATDEGINDELVKLNSEAAGVYIMPVEEDMVRLVSRLEERVSAGPEGVGEHSRADYSKIRTEVFKDSEGNKTEVTYSYQDAFLDLMNMIFSGELKGVSTDEVADRMNELKPVMMSLANGALTETEGDYEGAAPYYWETALSLLSFLNSLTAEPVSVTVTDIYAILRLAGPILVDTDYQPEGDPDYDAISYVDPLFSIIDNASSMVYSHHFDTLIARLKVLAPQPALDDTDISTEEPAAGDSVSKMPEEIINGIEEMGNSWLSIDDASWDTGDSELQDNTVYYLNVTLKAVAHIVPEDISLTIGSKEPVEDPEVTYEAGEGIVHAVYEYTVGEPEAVTVSFETGNGAEAPASVEVPKGRKLKYIDRPEFIDEYTENGKRWKFSDWQDENGDLWDDITVTGDIILRAVWLQVVDDIQIMFTVPAIGEEISAPYAPEDAPYYVYEYHVSDPEYNDVTAIESDGEYSITIFVKLKDDSAIFATELYEDGWGYYYSGTASVNGEDTEGWYDDMEVYVNMDYSFTPAREEPTPEPTETPTPEPTEEPTPEPTGEPIAPPTEDPELEPTQEPVPEPTEGPTAEPVALPSYSFVKGSGQEWIKGSGTDAEFIIKRSVDDSSTIGHFHSVEIDGNTIDSSSYTAEAGSLILKLKASYLETLPAGEHTLKAVFDDGSASAGFMIRQAEPEETEKPADKTPDTSDSSHTALWASLLAGSLLAACVIILMRRKYSK